MEGGGEWGRGGWRVEGRSSGSKRKWNGEGKKGRGIEGDVEVEGRCSG